MLKITGENLGYAVYENKNYSVCAYEQRSGAYGIEVEYAGHYLVQNVMIYPHNGLVAFENPEVLPTYVINKVYTLAEKIKKDGNHIPPYERD